MKPEILSADAVVFGLYETGLGVSRSLGIKHLNVVGVDYHKDVAWYSRFVHPILSPHPQKDENEFIQWLIDTFRPVKKPIPVFFTSDLFLMTFSKNRQLLNDFFSYNLVDHSLIESIFDKKKQALIAKSAGIDVPVTYEITSMKDVADLPDSLGFPVFLKGKNVNSWRTKISGYIKGFTINNRIDLNYKIEECLSKDVPIIIQDIIQGPDTNYFKYNVYISKNYEICGEFALQKIRQNPPHFGVGSLVESINFPELLEVGRKLFTGIGYKGIGSAEFKIDERDRKLKLIEINPRYWQQNYLATFCGVNFPFINFSDVQDKRIECNLPYETGIKWVNRYLDCNSFFKLIKANEINFEMYYKSLQGKKITSDFFWDDPLPGIMNAFLGLKLVKLPFTYFRA